MEKEALNHFGKFLVENLRDNGINYAELLLKNHWKAKELQELQTNLSGFSPQQKQIVLQAVTKSLDYAIHNFLFAVQEQADFDNTIQILSNQENIAEISDGLNGEAYGEDGWYAKFSKYPTEK